MLIVERCWDTGLDKILKPIAYKALSLHKEGLENLKDKIETEVDGYKVRLINNPIVNEKIFKQLFPYAKDAEKQINIEVKNKNTVWVTIFYLIKGVWVEDMRVMEKGIVRKK